MATTRTLLNNALYLSIADREFSAAEPSGSQINAALDRLIEILDIYKDQVPYWSTLETSNISDLDDVNMAHINYMQYVLGTVLYPMQALNQEMFSRINLIVNLRSIPSWYFHDKQNNKISVYPNPETTSDKFIIGFIPTINVTNLDEELPSSVTNFYRLFLEYEVARGLCDIYSVPWIEQKERSRGSYYKKLLDNAQRAPSAPRKPMIGGRRQTVPWLSYLSGNFPGGG